MKIKLYDDAAKMMWQAQPGFHNPQWVPSHNVHQFHDKLKQVQGQWLEVETDYLFRDQYNTAPIPGVSENGLRIMDDLVEAIEDDARPGKARCQWCGKTVVVTDVVEDRCPQCTESGYLHIF